MHGTRRDPLLARADEAIATAHRLVTDADDLLATAVMICRDREQSETLLSGLPIVWAISVLVGRSQVPGSADGFVSTAVRASWCAIQP
jgi:hypothetical protein